jgi:hypothetical protein
LYWFSVLSHIKQRQAGALRPHAHRNILLANAGDMKRSRRSLSKTGATSVSV